MTPLTPSLGTLSISLSFRRNGGRALCPAMRETLQSKPEIRTSRFHSRSRRLSMAIIYEIQPNIFAKYVPKLVTVLPDGTRFSRGTPIMVQLPAPIEYLTGHSANEPPLGLHNPIVPLMSDELIDALR